MASIGRNAPCRCGSGRKTKRCCGNEGGFDCGIIPAGICRQAVQDLAGVPPIVLYALFGRLVDLPRIDLSLHIRLPSLLSPQMERAIRSLCERDVAVFDDALRSIASALDSSDRRRALASAVLIQRDQGRIGRGMAAVAVLDLDRKRSTLFVFAVAESIAVLAVRRTPSGLVLPEARSTAGLTQARVRVSYGGLRPRNRHPPAGAARPHGPLSLQ
jgi:hypothetical protein